MSNRQLALRGALILAVSAAACGHPEQRVIDQYFNAVNAQDTQTLSSFATVRFEKKVTKWSILSVSAETKTPATLPDLVKQVKQIEKDIADNKRAANTYALEHLAEVDQARELMKKNAKIPPKLQPVVAEWEKYNQKDRDFKKALADAKDAVEKEKRDVKLSVGDLADLENLPGEATEKTVDLQLTIDGQAQSYTMHLKKYDLQSSGQQGRMLNRWVVHGLVPKS